MTALMIIGAVLLLLFLLLLPRISVDIVLGGDRQSIRLRYLFLRANLSPDKLGEKDKRKKDKKGRKKEKAAKPEEEKQKQSLREMLDLLRRSLKGSRKTIITLRRHLVFSRMRVFISVGGDDAHQTALRFSQINMLVAAALDVVGMLFILKKPKVCIMPHFAREDTRYEVAARIGIRPLFVLKAGLHMFSLLMEILLRGNKRAPARKERPLAKTA